MMTCGFLMLVCLLEIFVNVQNKRNAKELEQEAVKEAITVEVDEEKPEVEAYFVSIDFDALHSINEDIYAWITVPGTLINYPVLQSPDDKDTDYYLNTNLDLSSGYPGSIYTQRISAKDFSDPVTIVYGHNMKNGSMFAGLHKYEDALFFEENPYIYIYTQDETIIYQVAAAIWYDNRLIPDYFNEFESEDDYQDYIDSVYERQGNFDKDNTLTTDDRIIALSTCVKARPNERFYLIGKRLSDDEVAKIPDDLKKAAADATTGGILGL